MKVDEASIKKVVEAANVKTEPYWPMLYASILKDKDSIEEIIMKPGGGGSGGGAVAGSCRWRYLKRRGGERGGGRRRGGSCRRWIDGW